MHILRPSEIPLPKWLPLLFQLSAEISSCPQLIPTNPRDPFGTDSLLPAKERGRSLAFQTGPAKYHKEGREAGPHAFKGQERVGEGLEVPPYSLAGYPQERHIVVGQGLPVDSYN